MGCPVTAGLPHTVPTASCEPAAVVPLRGPRPKLAYAWSSGAAPAVFDDDDGFLAPHPARNARARRRVWRPCPPPGKRRRRLNAPYAGSPSPLQRFVECAYRRRVHLRLRCPSLRRFPANRRFGSSAVTEAPVHHDPRASPRCNGLTRHRSTGA